MNKKASIKFELFLAILAATAVTAVAPIVSAGGGNWKSFDGYYGSGVGAGVSGDFSGSQYYNCTWYAGRWLGSCQAYLGNLYFTFYANGSPIMNGSATVDTYVTGNSGPYSAIGASASSVFYDSRIRTFSLNTGYIGLP